MNELIPPTAEPEACVRPRSSAGFAVPTVLFMIIALLASTGVAAMTVARVQGGTTRDTDSKAAIAVAESAANRAVYDYNRLTPADNTPCISVSGGNYVTTGLPASGWCAPITGSVGRGSSSYVAAPSPAGLAVVATGTVGAATRRVELTGHTTTLGVNKPFTKASVIGLDRILIDTDSVIAGDIATNGTVQIGVRAKLCGNAQLPSGGSPIFGNGSSFGGAGCTAWGGGGGGVTYGSVSAPPLAQSDVPLNISNARLSGSPPADPSTGPAPVWSASARTLTLNSGTTLTLRGGNYRFCKILTNSNSRLYLAPGVRLFFDSPETCGQSSGVTQLDVAAGSFLVGLGDPTDVFFFFVGSPTKTTRINLNAQTTVPLGCRGASGNEGFVIYAPQTLFTVNAQTQYCGAVLAKSITMAAQPTTVIDSRFDVTGFDLGGVILHFVIDRFVECRVPGPTSQAQTC